jgi:hypothetical protein
LAGRERWTSAVEEYWQHWGSTIGNEVTAVPAPASAGGSRAVKTRTMRIQPAVVSSIVPRDLNIVVDRLPAASADPLRPGRGDQRTRLLRPVRACARRCKRRRDAPARGVFVTNTAVLPTTPLRPTAAYLRVAHTAERYDDIFCYQPDEW